MAGVIAGVLLLTCVAVTILLCRRSEKQIFSTKKASTTLRLKNATCVCRKQYNSDGNIYMKNIIYNMISLFNRRLRRKRERQAANSPENSSDDYDIMLPDTQQLIPL